MTIGFDIGGQNSKAAVTRPAVGRSGGNMIDIALDEASKRSVAPYIGFPEKERTFGLTAKKAFKSNIQSTIVQPQRLLGCSMQDIPQSYSSSVPIIANPSLTTNGVQTPAFQLNYQGEDIIIPPEHAVACMLKHQTKHAEALKVTSKECCITIPNNCSYAKRQALLTAANIAGVDCLKLISATSSMALDYGILGRKSQQETDSAIIFIDLGHTEVNVGCVHYFKGGWDIVLLDSCDQFSGSIMETKIVDLFNQKFMAANKESFIGNLKSVEKIRTLIPKLLKTLVVDEQASMHVDYLYKDKDFKLQITREELRQMLEAETKAFEDFLKGFLTLAKEKIAKFEKCPFEAVEVVGQVSRMLDVKTLLQRVCKEVIGIEKLSTTCNTEESIVKGCVLQCAILSPRFGIRGGKVKDVIPYSIVLSRQPMEYDVSQWKSLESYDTLFPFLNELNKTKTIKFKKPRSLKLILCERTMRNEQQMVGHASIDTSHVKLEDGEEWTKFQILVTLDQNGLLSLRSEITKQTIEMVDVPKKQEVEMSEEEYAEAVKKAQDAAKKKAEEEMKKKLEAKKKAAEEEAKKKAESGEETGDNAEAAPEVQEDEVMADVQVPEVKVSKMKTVTVTEKQEKKVFKKIDIPVVFISHMQMSDDQVKAIKANEEKMSAFDAECRLVQESRNHLETYVLDSQEEFADGGQYFEFMTSEESDNFMNSIFEMDDWLADDDFDKTAAVYIEKLESLKTVGDVYVVRCKEFKKRDVALTTMRKACNTITAWLDEGCKAEEFAHIGEDITKELAEKLSEALAWLDERQQLSSNASKNQDPPFYANEVTTKAKEINNAFIAVKNTPKPEPKKEEKKEETKAEETKEESADAKKTEADGDVEMEDVSGAGDAKKEDVEMENTTS